MNFDNVYCVTGYPGAGKGVFADVAENLGVPVISMGDRIRERYPDDGSYSHTGEFATQMRDEHGMDIVARWTEEHLEDVSESTVVIEGIRSLDELAYFERSIEEFSLVLITADDERRLERLRERDREDEGAFTLDDLQERDEREESWGLDEVVTKGEYIELTNNGSLAEFEQKVTRILR